jgi:hypothetical protein
MEAVEVARISTRADALRDANRDWLRDTDHADANCDLTLLTSQTASSVSGRFSS